MTVLCRWFGHRAPIRTPLYHDHDGRVELHTCPRCGHEEEAEYDIEGERLLPARLEGGE